MVTMLEKEKTFQDTLESMNKSQLLDFMYLYNQHNETIRRKNNALSPLRKKEKELTMKEFYNEFYKRLR